MAPDEVPLVSDHDYLVVMSRDVSDLKRDMANVCSRLRAWELRVVGASSIVAGAVSLIAAVWGK